MPWYDEDWQYRKKITVPGANVAGSGAIASLPIFFDPSADADILAGARSDGFDIVITEADGETKLPHELLPEKQFITRNGGRSWFSHPSAVYDEGSNKLFVGSINTSGVQQCHEFDGDTGALTSNTINSSSAGDNDHENPALLIRSSDSKLLAFYTETQSAAAIKVALSDNVLDSSAWTEASIDPMGGGTHTYTYSQLHEITNGIYLIYSSLVADHQWGMCKSTDNGANWGTNVLLNSSQTGGFGDTPYLATASNGSRIDFLITSAGPADGSPGLKVGHFYFDGTDWFNSAGVDIGDPPFDFTEITTVYDGTSGTNIVWLGDIAYRPTNGSPHVLFYVYPASDKNDQDLYYGSVSAGTWTAEKVMDEGNGSKGTGGGNDEYHGAAALDHDVDQTIWASKKETVYEIQTWNRASGSWAKLDDVTTGSTYNHFRPNVTKGMDVGAPGRVQFLSPFAYTTYDNWTGGITAFPALGTNFRRCYFLGDVHGTSDTDFYVYYGNPAVTDQQERTDVWVGDICRFHTTEHYGATPGYYRDASGNQTTIQAFAVLVSEAGNDNVGPLWIRSGGNGIPLGQPNYAGASAVSAGCWFKSDLSGAGGNEHTLVGLLANNDASWGSRIENATGVLEAYVTLESNNLEPDNPNVETTGITVVADTYCMSYFGWSNPGGIVCRINQTEGAIANTDGANLDATASGITYAAGINTGDKLVGEIAEIWVRNGSIRSKDFTDTQYDNWTDGNSFFTIGSEEEFGASVETTVDYTPGSYTLDITGKSDITGLIWSGGGGGAISGGGGGGAWVSFSIPDTADTLIIEVGDGGAGGTTSGDDGEQSSIILDSELTGIVVGGGFGAGGSSPGNGGELASDEFTWATDQNNGGPGGNGSGSDGGGGGGAGGVDSAGTAGGDEDGDPGVGGAGGGAESGDGSDGTAGSVLPDDGEAFGGGGGGRGTGTLPEHVAGSGGPGHIRITYTTSSEPGGGSQIIANWLPIGISLTM